MDFIMYFLTKNYCIALDVIKIGFLCKTLTSTLSTHFQWSIIHFQRNKKELEESLSLYPKDVA